MASPHKDIQRMLENDPDAVECGACDLLYKPEKSDGIFIVHVIRLKGSAPGSEGIPVCNDCLEIFKETGELRKDSIVLH